MGDFNKGGFNRGPRDMHKAVCAECGQECEVPFKPQEGRDVFCKECYRKKKSY
ncbi:MAG: CxxC-x17-CxxC domain-containing protein [Candidatus Woesearchaeota archaeon]